MTTIRQQDVSRRQEKAFTLVEVLVAVVLLIAVLLPLLGILSNSVLMTQDNRLLTKATYLANEIKEWSGFLLKRPTQGTGDYKTIWDLQGKTFSPPVSAPDMSNPTSPTPLTDHAGWSQVISLSRRDEGNPVLADTLGTSLLVRMQCVVLYNGKEIYRLLWLVKETATS